MTALEQYLGGLSDKRVGVIGAGVSNMPLIRMLRASGVRVTVHDKKEPTELGDGYATLATLGVDFVLGEHYLDALDEDVIFRTPGVHPRFLEKAQAGGSEITARPRRPRSSVRFSGTQAIPCISAAISARPCSRASAK